MKTILTTLVIAACISPLAAQPRQSPGGQQQQGGQGQQPPPPPPNGQRPPPPPLVGAIDANHDGVISADEIANASEALKQLDQDGDGQLSREEFCPPPPPRNGGGNRQDAQSENQQSE
jgi:hypothetical protein